MAFWWLHYSPGKWGKHRNHRNQQEIIAKFSDELAVWRNHRNHKTIPRTIPCIQEHLMSLRCFAASLRRGHFGIPFFPIFLGFYHTFTTEKWRTRKKHEDVTQRCGIDPKNDETHWSTRENWTLKSHNITTSSQKFNMRLKLYYCSHVKS